MSVADVLRPDGSSYDAFLFAEMGEDRNGAGVTVLSALARLGLDPWTEARELALLDQDAAQARLKAHLVTVEGVPALGNECVSVAIRLVSLLPEPTAQRVSKPPRTAATSGPRIRTAWMVVFIIGVLALARVYFLVPAG